MAGGDLMHLPGRVGGAAIAELGEGGERTGIGIYVGAPPDRAFLATELDRFEQRQQRMAGDASR